MFSQILERNSYNPLFSIAGHFIPKNTIIIPNLYGAHHDPDVWNDPYSFKPGTKPHKLSDLSNLHIYTCNAVLINRDSEYDLF